MCLQSNPKCYEQFSTKFLKYFISANFLLPHSVKRSRILATATASLLWRKCLEFCGEKSFTILNVYVYALVSYSFSFDPSLWWPLLLSTAALKGHAWFHTSRQASQQCESVFPAGLGSVKIMVRPLLFLLRTYLRVMLSGLQVPTQLRV